MGEEKNINISNYILGIVATLLIAGISWTAKTLISTKEDLSVLTVKVTNQNNLLESISKDFKYTKRIYDNQIIVLSSEINDIKSESIRHNKNIRYSYYQLSKNMDFTRFQPTISYDSITIINDSIK